jgi:hypothetical protein
MTGKNSKSRKYHQAGAMAGKTILSIGEKILLELIEHGDDVLYYETHRYAIGTRDVRAARHESEEIMRLYEIKMKKKAMERLRQSRFVKMRNEGSRVIWQITANGRVKALKAAIRSSTDYFHDNRFCLVSFDFPEAAENARNVFRRFLKSAGFVFVQGSVWSIKKDVAIRMNELAGLLKISRWIEVYTVIK